MQRALFPKAEENYYLELENQDQCLNWYLSLLASNLNGPILAVFYRRATMMHQGPISGRGVESRDSCSPCSDPLGKGSLTETKHSIIDLN